MLQVAVLPVEITCLDGSGEHCPMWPVRWICFFHNSESRVSYYSQVNKSVIPLCGQMFMSTPTHIVLHPLSRRIKSEYAHVLNTRRQVSPKSHHSLICFITKHKHSAAIKAKVKGILQKELWSLVSMPNTLKGGTRHKNHMKTHCSPLLRCCGGLPWWDQQLSQTLCKRCDTSHGTFQEDAISL